MPPRTDRSQTPQRAWTWSSPPRQQTSPPDWIEALQARGIAVTTGVRRQAARDVLLAYREAGGVIYNPHGRDAS